jgi:threonine dehydratase
MDHQLSSHLSLSDIFSARKFVSHFCVRTPTILSEGLSAQTGAAVHLKLEMLQETGAFKVRGAASKLARLSVDEKERGVVTASTGNHGRAVAWVARKLGIPATVCISEDVPQNKVSAIRALGAEVDIFGHSQDEAFLRAEHHQQQHEKIMVHPFDDPHIIAGQGTLGLELLEDLPDLDTVLVPLSGGGLLSGIAFTLKAIKSGLRVIGVSMERGPVMYHSLKVGKPVQLDEEETIADSLRGGIGLENQYTFQIIRDMVDEVILVSETEIAQAMAFLLKEHQLVVEGAGAVGIGALLSGKVTGAGEVVAVVLSGRNIDIKTYLNAVQPYSDL